MPSNNLLNISKFVAPEVIFGLGALSQVGESAVRLGIKKAFLVSDEGVMEAGWVDKALYFLNEAGITAHVWHGLTTNPKDYEVAAGAEHYLASGCDGIVAVGGGSPIDVAKAIAILATNGGQIKDYEGVNKISSPLPPMVMVSSTGGSGAEVSQFSMIVEKQRQVKMAIISKSLIPDIAIVDPSLLQTKSARLTAATGVDALSHAIEAYVSLAATPLTDVHALAAIRLIAANLRESVACRTNLAAKSAMAMASLQAGLAFSNAILGATHAMTHQVDGLLDLHHGETNGILLPYVMEFNMISCGEKFVNIAAAMGVQTEGLGKWKAAARGIAAIRRLFKDIGIPERLSQVGMKEEHIRQLSINALKDACLVTNPRDCSAKEIEELYRRAL
ncbi:iron-containing alcohol dehydrogenase [Desulforamulus hydrothermalis]|uniref:Fe-containing alcohol dehydrogenase n=1 Tax=Desulforamulus hydrothermalis Lam5 = DSM 18033 TaxID=1121428 RepID=K8E0X4_9FIRM|nr:iron-containing alcohol dehydrogenase [Desulforamulus hydrothermalis]CCO09307.1 Fe-containing alcohol dehydrogenase [Desulforamulus hydrothermalis Lam5 = DSM 18033]SHH04472.1 1,3-propanediol dehydrogenase [Desulforamulus hydrothermalis Lam5 = DSM 18033]